MSLTLVQRIDAINASFETLTFPDEAYILVDVVRNRFKEMRREADAKSLTEEVERVEKWLEKVSSKDIPKD